MQNVEKVLRTENGIKSSHTIIRPLALVVLITGGVMFGFFACSISNVLDSSANLTVGMRGTVEHEIQSDTTMCTIVIDTLSGPTDSNWVNPEGSKRWNSR